MNIDRLITTLGAVLSQQAEAAAELHTAYCLAMRQADYTHTLIRLASAHQTHKTQQSREALRRALERMPEWAEVAKELT